MVKKNYKEGDWFAVPLEPDGYAVGLAARNTPRGAKIVAYFFGERYRFPPELSELEGLQAKDAIRRMQIGDLGLINGEWTVIGRFPDWNRTLWPMPNFVRCEPITNRIWLVTYSDDDPSHVVSEKRITEKVAAGLEPNVLSGYKSAEMKLSQAIKEMEKK